jgi:hypothetical protein
MSAVRGWVGDALVCAEVPVEMHVLLLAAFFGGEEAAAASRTLIGSAIVELVDQLRTKGLERGGGQGYI